MALPAGARALLFFVAASVGTSAFASSAGAVAAGQVRQRTLEEAWSRELAPETRVVEYKDPVKRVVNLLGEMKAEIEKEASAESEQYDKWVCWCETSGTKLTKSIAKAEAKDLDLSAETESRSARYGELSTEISRSKQQIADDTEALSEATSIREKQAGKFKGDEKDLVQAIDNLRNAIAVLSKFHGGSFVQLDAPLVSGMRVLLRDVALKYEMLLAGKPSSGRAFPARARAALVALSADTERTGEQGAQGVSRALLSALDVHGAGVSEQLPLKFAERMVARSARSGRAARTPTGFLQSGASAPVDADYKSYSARSSQIFGVLKQMLEEFQSELGTSQKDELKSKSDYEALAAAKTSQITVGKEKLDNLEGDSSANSKALSDAKEDLALTRNQRSADVKLLQSSKSKCLNIESDWKRVSKTRSEELKAVSEAIAILSEDDSRELLAKSVTLLQERSETKASANARVTRSRAAALLRRAAQMPAFEADDLLAAWRGRHGVASAAAAAGAGLVGPRAQLSTLALTVQLDAFTKVKKMMDKMVAQLKEEQEEEVKFKANCEKELDENEKAVFTKKELKEDHEMKIEELESLMKKLAAEMAEDKAAIADKQAEIKEASQDRESTNAEFQSIVADQRAAQAVLKKALLRLQDFYAKGIGKQVGNEGFLQRSAQEPPAEFNSYKANKGSTPVIGLLEQILSDSKTLETDSIAAEYKSQADYETFVKDSNDLIADLSASVAAKTKATASAQLEMTETKASLDSTEGELESLAAYEADLHSQCDFVLKNFDIRQKARLQEMEAISSAKGILAGAAEQ